MGHMSNRERIARAAEEAKAAADEKAAKKGSKETETTTSKRRVKPPARVKIVWEIRTGSGKVVKTFAYAEKDAAEAELGKLTRNGSTHLLLANKVPME